MDVTLPDGTVVTGVPDDMSKADFTASMQRNGYLESAFTPRGTQYEMLPTKAPAIREATPADKPREGIAGLGRNWMDEATGMVQGAVQLPGAVKHLASGAAQLIPGLNYTTGDAAQDKIDKEFVQGIPSAIGSSIANTARGVYSGRLTPADLGRWAYDHPASTAMMFAAPAAKFLSTSGETLSTLSALKAAQQAPVAANLYNAGAKTLSGAGKIARYTDPGQIAGSVLRGSGKVLGGLTDYIGAVIDPRSAELSRLVGPRIPKIVSALEANTTPYISSGEVVANAGLGENIYPALQNALKDATPAASRAYSEAELAREARRQGLLKGAMTPDEIADLTKTTRAEGNKLYDVTKEPGHGVDMQSTIDKANELIKAHPNEPLITTPLKNLKSQLQIVKKGKVVGLVDDPQKISSAMQNLIDNTPDISHIGEKLGTVIGEIKTNLPFYKEADAQYKNLFSVVHRGSIAGYLKGQLEKGPEAFVDAFDDQLNTVAKATKQDYFTKYAPIFKNDPAAFEDLYKLRNDALSEHLYNEAAKAGKGVVKDVFKPEKVFTGNWMNTTASFANAAAHRLQGNITKSVAEKMALDFLDPKKAIPALQKAAAKSARAAKFESVSNKGINALTAPVTEFGYQGIDALGDKYNVLVNDSIPK